MNKGSGKKAILEFSASLLIILAIYAVSAIKTDEYNRARHSATFEGPALFSTEAEQKGEVSVKAVPRSSTWGKIFDFNNEGLTDNLSSCKF